MKSSALLFALTIANFALLVFQLLQPHGSFAQEISPVVRTHAMEIVDDRGRVRAQIRIFPPDSRAKMPDGTTGYPETVIFRLSNSNGRPNVKIAALEDGSTIALGGDSDPTDIQILARGAETSMKLTNRTGKQQLVKP